MPASIFIACDMPLAACFHYWYGFHYIDGYIRRHAASSFERREDVMPLFYAERHSVSFCHFVTIAIADAISIFHFFLRRHFRYCSFPIFWFHALHYASFIFFIDYFHFYIFADWYFHILFSIIFDIFSYFDLRHIIFMSACRYSPYISLVISHLFQYFIIFLISAYAWLRWFSLMLHFLLMAFAFIAIFIDYLRRRHYTFSLFSPFFIYFASFSMPLRWHYFHISLSYYLFHCHTPTFTLLFALFSFISAIIFTPLTSFIITLFSLFSFFIFIAFITPLFTPPLRRFHDILHFDHIDCFRFLSMLFEISDFHFHFHFLPHTLLSLLELPFSAFHYAYFRRHISLRFTPYAMLWCFHCLRHILIILYYYYDISFIITYFASLLPLLFVSYITLYFIVSYLLFYAIERYFIEMSAIEPLLPLRAPFCLLFSCAIILLLWLRMMPFSYSFILLRAPSYYLRLRQPTLRRHDDDCIIDIIDDADFLMTRHITMPLILPLFIYFLSAITNDTPR